MADNQEKQKKNAKSIAQLIADQNKLIKEQLRIIKDQAGVESERLSEQQDISNVLKDQIKQLKFQKAERLSILKSVNSITKVANENYVTGQNELGTLKGIAKIQKDRVGIEADIRNLINAKKKIIADSKILSKEDQIVQNAIANSIQDQVDEAIRLKDNLVDVEKTSKDIQGNFGVKGFAGLADISKAIPGLSQFSEPFATAADASRKMASGIENAAKSGGKGLTKERIKQLGLEKELGKLSGAAAAQKLKGMSGMQKGMLSLRAGFSALGPIIAKALGPVAVAVELLKAFKGSDEGAGNLAKAMNMTYNDALRTRSELTQIGNAQSNVFKVLSRQSDLSATTAVNTKELQETLMAVNASLGTNVMLSEDMLIQFSQLRKMAGFTNEELMGIASLSLSTGDEMEDITGEFMAQAQVSSLQNGVLLNEKELVKGIKDISAATTLSFAKNPGLIADAVATAKSLGMEMSKVENIAGSLLNFEESIENELQAELLLGKNINLEKARQAALNNDLATVAKEISDQIGSSADFAEMNRIQQEALAKSVGMSREDLAETLFIQEQLKGATGEKAKEEEKILNARIAAVGLEQAQKELAEGGLENLKNQQSTAERFANAITKLKEVFVTLAEPILLVADALMPVVEFVGLLVSGIMGISGAVGGALGSLKELGAVGAVLGGILAVLASAMAFTALSYIPIVGPALGIAAGIAIMGAYFKSLTDTKSRRAGDMFGGNGKTQISPAEGGLFELSPNDQFAASPQLGEIMSRGMAPSQKPVVVENDNSDVVNAIKNMSDKINTGTLYEIA